MAPEKDRDMSAKPVSFKKRAVAGACRAMRCKICEPEKLYEFDTGDPRIGVALLCEGHWRRAEENKTAPAPVGPTVVPPVETTVFPPDAGAAAPLAPVADVGARTEVIVPHAPLLAMIEPMRAQYALPPGAVMTIDSQEKSDQAGTLLKTVNRDVKALEAKRVEITGPMLKAKKAVDDLFRPGVEAGKTLAAMLRSAIGAYVDAQAAAQTTALEAGQHETALAVVQPTMASGVSTRTVWKWRITNENLIPREFWVIDSAKVQAHVNANKGNSAIPGVEAYPETGISASASG